MRVPRFAVPAGLLGCAAGRTRMASVLFSVLARWWNSVVVGGAPCRMKISR